MARENPALSSLTRRPVRVFISYSYPHSTLNGCVLRNRPASKARRHGAMWDAIRIIGPKCRAQQIKSSGLRQFSSLRCRARTIYVSGGPGALSDSEINKTPNTGHQQINKLESLNTDLTRFSDKYFGRVECRDFILKRMRPKRLNCVNERLRPVQNEFGGVILGLQQLTREIVIICEMRIVLVLHRLGLEFLCLYVRAAVHFVSCPRNWVMYAGRTQESIRNEHLDFVRA